MQILPKIAQPRRLSYNIDLSGEPSENVASATTAAYIDLTGDDAAYIDLTDDDESILERQNRVVKNLTQMSCH